MVAQMAVSDAENLVTRAQEMQERLGRRGIEVGKFLRRLEQAIVTRQVF
jgi:hypothetical protein